MTCKEIEKMVMPYINHELGEEQLEAFLTHVDVCRACKEELEIYYTVDLGIKQLDTGTGAYDIKGALEQSLAVSRLRLKAFKLRKIICYAVNTLCILGLTLSLLLQARLWWQDFHGHETRGYGIHMGIF